MEPTTANLPSGVYKVISVVIHSNHLITLKSVGLIIVYTSEVTLHRLVLRWVIARGHIVSAFNNHPRQRRLAVTETPLLQIVVD